MKAILVIDVPMLDDGRHLCNECPIWNDKQWFCQYDRNMQTKGCPLKPMPERVVENVWSKDWRAGWNAYYDTLTDFKDNPLKKEIEKC